MALTKAKASNILLTTPAASSNDTTPATTEYVTTAIANLIDSAPANLNTLNELAAAMADNASFFSTVLPLSGGTMTGALTGTKASFDTASTTDYALRLTDNGVASYDVIFPDTSTYQLTTNTTSDKTFKLLNSGSGTFNLSVEGSVGIGTSSPDQTLHVYKGASGNTWNFDTGDAFVLENNNSVSINITTPSANGGNILFSDADARGQGRIVYEHSNDSMGFYTAGVSNERMRIESNGNVNINHSSFSAFPTNAKFTVFGDGEVLRIDGSGNTTRKFRFRNVSDANPGVIVADGSLKLETEDANTDIRLSAIRDIEYQTTSTNSTAGDHKFKVYNTEAMVIKGSNNQVKIGPLATASATSAPLHVAVANTDVQAVFGDNNASIDDPQIRVIGRNTANSTGRYTFMGLDADANHGFIGYNAGAGAFVNALSFNTSGNVGIGTTAPASKLHIGSNAVAANDVTLLTLENGNSTADLSTPDTFIDFTFTDGNTNVTPQARIGAHAGDGGDANTQALEGKGYLTFHTSDTTATSGVVAPPERMRIDNAGRVTMPYQPSFKIAWATRSATGSNRFLSGNAGDSQYTGRDTHNTGNHFSVATGRFTVPVAGTYFFGFHGMRDGTNGSGLECRIKKNGNLMWARAYQSSFSHSHQYWAISTITSAAVGDYFQVFIGPNTSIYYDDTYFYGYLIG